jgi:hypothetical protein
VDVGRAGGVPSPGDDRDDPLGRMHVEPMLYLDGPLLRGDPLVEIVEVDGLLVRRRLSDPLLIAVVAERDRGRTLLDRLWQIERGVGHDHASRA